MPAFTPDFWGTRRTRVTPSQISVRAAPYNATGDGTTDDTAAIQSAINAAPAGSVVFFPTGTYKVNSTVTACLQTAANNVTLKFASNAIIQAASTTTVPLLLVKHNRVLIAGGTFDSSLVTASALATPITFSTSSADGSKAVGCTFKGYNQAVTVSSASGVGLVGCAMQSCYVDAIASPDVTIGGCTFTNTSNQLMLNAVYARAGSPRATVSTCTINNPYAAKGVVIGATPGGETNNGAAQIRNNTITVGGSSTTGTNIIGIYLVRSDDHVVVGNTVARLDTAAGASWTTQALATWQPDVTNTTGCARLTITDNIVTCTDTAHACLLRQGFRLQTKNSYIARNFINVTGSGFLFDTQLAILAYTNGLQDGANTVEFNDVGGGFDSIVVYASNGNTVQNNISRNGGGYAYYVRGGAANNVFRNNSAIDQFGNTVAYGIEAGTTNTFDRNTAQTVTADVNSKLIFVAAGCTNNVFTNNTAFGAQIGILVSDAGTGTTNTNNVRV